jgi:hypothetical protein
VSCLAPQGMNVAHFMETQFWVFRTLNRWHATRSWKPSVGFP